MEGNRASREMGCCSRAEQELIEAEDTGSRGMTSKVLYALFYISSPKLNGLLLIMIMVIVDSRCMAWCCPLLLNIRSPQR